MKRMKRINTDERIVVRRIIPANQGISVFIRFIRFIRVPALTRE